ncbi:hypothetical protein V1477_011701 [Vespula maculifrons]|uniref:Uncharacterized protein n=1 Tax=Vespula maculifrons TaxID=7453 RepID=A0ABD2BZY2_VESMC
MQKTESNSLPDIFFFLYRGCRPSNPEGQLVSSKNLFVTLNRIIVAETLFPWQRTKMKKSSGSVGRRHVNYEEFNSPLESPHTPPSSSPSPSAPIPPHPLLAFSLPFPSCGILGIRGRYRRNHDRIVIKSPLSSGRHEIIPLDFRRSTSSTVPKLGISRERSHPATSPPLYIACVGRIQGRPRELEHVTRTSDKRCKLAIIIRGRFFTCLLKRKLVLIILEMLITHRNFSYGFTIVIQRCNKSTEVALIDFRRYLLNEIRRVLIAIDKVIYQSVCQERINI